VSTTRMPPKAAGIAALPGAAVVARIRRVLVVSLIAGLVYPLFMSGSRGRCAGGVDAPDGFTDTVAGSVGEATRCIVLTLGPSPLVYLGIVVIVLVALGRVIGASDERSALKILDRTMVGVGVLVVVAIVVSQVWLHMIPLEEFMAGSASVFSPFPFGFIDVANDPISGP
jgi:energy-converting hydrogenase Eha subunit E